MKHVLSLGVGVQSSTLALMAECGEICPRPECGIFGDTKDEPGSVYSYFDYLKSKISFPLHVVGKKDSLSDLAATVRVSKKTGLNYLKHLIPVYMKRASGKRGMMQRQCTLDTKIEPVRMFSRDRVVGRLEYLKWRKKHKEALVVFNDCVKAKTPVPFSIWTELQDDALVCMWIGISTDEADRAKDSLVPWIKNRFPLLEKEMSRNQCLIWNDKKGLQRPPKSSCIQCPYHDDNHWIDMRDNRPEEFAFAVKFDYRYRESVSQCSRLDGVPYLHNSLVPLDKVVFVPNKKPDIEQSPCEGMCGL